ncbi:SRPBCC family protein [Umezawaea sp. Da 62-37]|uniref:SRPBCC family protein n=1 Tax=Umezawaea sp. Da 62-37 TaxID=3075927 RepID=UPI0028F6D2CB|nr:SRPBCC family protein [Umezawaea sp. Da 62-37]WNV85161.1 SRPBCC family protein [Umezawaea sp. Da 62-37]
MTRNRSTSAAADTVFGIITDLEDLHTWLPRAVEVERYGPGLLRLWLRNGDHDETVERGPTVDRDSLRGRWHSEATTSYTGALRVPRVGADRCAITVDLVGGTGMPAVRVEDWLARALDSLATVVAEETSRTRGKSHLVAGGRPG